MVSLPFTSKVDQFLVHRRADTRVDFIFEVIGDLLEIHDPRVIDIFVGEAWPCNSEAVLVGTHKVRAKPFQPDFAHGLRRLQMKQGWNEADLLEVILVGLARESKENVPGDLDVIVQGPFETLDILHRADALVHLMELSLAQTLNARLHALHATLRERLDLAFGKVALGLDEDVQVQPLRRARAEQVVDVFHVDNIIHQPEPSGVIAVRE